MANDEEYEDALYMEEEDDAKESALPKPLIFGLVFGGGGLLVLFLLWAFGIFSGDSPAPPAPGNDLAALQAKRAAKEAAGGTGTNSTAIATKPNIDPNILDFSQVTIPCYVEGKNVGMMYRARPGLAIGVFKEQCAPDVSYRLLVPGEGRHVLSEATLVARGSFSFYQDKAPMYWAWMSYADPFIATRTKTSKDKLALDDHLIVLNMGTNPQRQGAQFSGSEAFKEGEIPKMSGSYLQTPPLLISADGLQVYGFAQFSESSIIGHYLPSEPTTASIPHAQKPDSRGIAIHEDWAEALGDPLFTPPLTPQTRPETLEKILECVTSLNGPLAIHLGQGKLWIPDRWEADSIGTLGVPILDRRDKTVVAEIRSNGSGRNWAYAPELKRPGTGISPTPPPAGESCVILDSVDGTARPIPATSVGPVTVYPGAAEGWLVRASGTTNIPPHLAVFDSQGRLFGTPILEDESQDKKTRLPAKLRSNGESLWLVNALATIPEFKEPFVDLNEFKFGEYSSLSAIRPGLEGPLLIADRSLLQLNPETMETVEIGPAGVPIYDAVDLPGPEVFLFALYRENRQWLLYNVSEEKVVNNQIGILARQKMDEKRTHFGLPNAKRTTVAMKEGRKILFVNTRTLLPYDPNGVVGEEIVYWADKDSYLIRDTKTIQVTDGQGKTRGVIQTPNAPGTISEGGKLLGEFLRLKKDALYDGFQPVYSRRIETQWIAIGTTTDGEVRALLPQEPDSLYLFDEPFGGMLILRKGDQLALIPSENLHKVGQ